MYRSAVRQFDSRVRAVRPEQWSSSTPDTDWDVQHLVRHVIAGQANVPALLAGREPNRLEMDAQTPGPELVGYWADACAGSVAALTALSSLDTPVQLPGGPASAEQLGWRLAIDLTVHAWDLARAINAADEFPNDLLAAILDHAKNSADEWFPAERYASPIPVPGCTDDLTELLALTGRNRWWRRQT